MVQIRPAWTFHATHGWSERWSISIKDGVNISEPLTLCSGIPRTSVPTMPTPRVSDEFVHLDRYEFTPPTLIVLHGSASQHRFVILRMTKKSFVKPWLWVCGSVSLKNKLIGIIECVSQRVISRVVSVDRN